MTLFFPLDVEYASDDEFIDAGPMAELLFVRAGCFIKRKSLDGRLKKSQLSEVAQRIPSPAKHARALCEVGLWVDEGDYWSVPSYLKRNPSKAHLNAAKEIAVESGARGAHQRWHVPPEGSPSPKCAICVAERMGNPMGVPNASPIGSDSQQQPQQQPQPQPTENLNHNPTSIAPSSSSSKSQPNRPVDDDDFHAAIEILVDHRVAGRPISNERGYRAAVRREAIELDGDQLQGLIDDGFDPRGAVDMLLEVEVMKNVPKRSPIPWCGPDCDLCEGSAFVEADGGLAPCPNRSDP